MYLVLWVLGLEKNLWKTNKTGILVKSILEEIYQKYNQHMKLKQIIK